MCGIAGIFHYQSDEPVAEVTLRRMTARLAHRGPDGDGFLLAGEAGLGHRRLSIIDVAGGQQPIRNEDGSIAVVCNGEIYNYRALTRLVEGRGHRLKTKSDTETIVHLYEEFGDDCVQMLDGMFAFALWDGRRRRMLLARDRVGKKPLYYSDHQGRFVFGSELKAVIADERVPRVLDEQAVADYFSFQYVPAPRSSFRHVRKLRAGHYLTVEAGGAREHEYWDIDFSQVEQRSEHEWAEQLLEALRRAVGARLMSEVPLGAFLSSGVDSSAVVALMTELSGRAVTTASIGFTEERYSELADARRFAQHVGATHHERIVAPDAVAVIEKLAWHFDEPFADASAIPTFYVSQAAREFVTVALSGDGGDESFAGYRRYRFDAAENRVRQFAPAALRRPLFGALARVYPQAAWLPQPLRAKATLSNLARDPAAAYFHSVYGAMANQRDDLLSNDLKQQLGAYDPFALFLDHFNRARTDDPLSRAQYVDIKTYLTDDVLAKVDRASMAVALEVRCPLLDHRVLELAARMPSQLKLRRGAGKYIFKRAVSRLLPPEVLARRKRGFVVPLPEWLRSDLRDMAGDLLFAQASDGGLLQRAAIERLWRAHQSGARDYSRSLWAVLMFRLWQREFASAAPSPHRPVASSPSR